MVFYPEILSSGLGEQSSTEATDGLTVGRYQRTRGLHLAQVRMRDRYHAPLAFNRAVGWHYTDPEWRLPSISLSQGELFALKLGARMLEAYAGSAFDILTHSYSSICLLPVLADAVVVIDEVHSFSGKMFGHLCSFLEHFDIPVLCMTATLPPSRKHRLEEYLQVFPAQRDRELEELEERPRYRIEPPIVATQNRDATQAYQEGLKAAEELAISVFRVMFWLFPMWQT